MSTTSAPTQTTAPCTKCAAAAQQPAPARYESLEDVAARLGCTPRTIRRMIADGQITGYRFGKRFIRVSTAEVDAMVRPIPAGFVGIYGGALPDPGR